MYMTIPKEDVWMKKSFQIFKRDLGRLFRNRAAVLILVGISVLPSLYAWFNIAVNMDPYGNTKGIQVAIANEDKGADSEQMSLDAGQNIVDNLKKNDQLGWKFVDAKEAKKGVRSGKYYAAIVIPDNFSESLLSILSGDIKQPELDYYINEKKNAIAPKITDTGAGTIQQEINDTFSSVAAESISKLLSEKAGDIAGRVTEGNSSLIRAVAETRKNLEEYNKVLENFQKTVDKSDEVIQNAVKTLDQVNASAKSGVQTLSDSGTVLSDTRTAVGIFSTQFSDSMSNGETLLNNTYVSASAKLGIFETKAGQALTAVDGSLTTASTLLTRNQELLSQLKALNEQIQGNTELSQQFSALIAQKISELESQNASLQGLVASLKNGNKGIQNAVTTAQSTRTSLEKLAKDSKESLQDYRSNFAQTLMPQLNQSLDSLASLSGSLSSTLDGVEPTVEQMKSILNQLNSSLKDSASALGQTKEVLKRVDESLASVQDDLGALQSSQMYQKLTSLEGIDADSIAGFMSSPVSIQSKVLYDVENYGSGMTPFYTNLALWVGGLILVSILKQEVDRDGKIHRFTASQAYFGRWMLFMAVGLVQGLIVCLGDIVLLKVQCVHPVAFVCVGIFCSFIYVNLIYALALTFKHIGKALGVVLVILQIPGSAGTYPIEMTPAFFQKLHPLLPFTYGISAMRECIAGMYGANIWRYLGILAIFFPISIFIGLVLRPLLMNLNHLFDKRLSETELMLGETETAERKRPELTMMMKTLMEDDEWKQEFLERSEKFEKRYPKMIRFGFLGMIIIPLIFLILMFSLESKLVFLVLWIVSLIALALYLICVEYIHDKMLKQLAATGMTTEDLIRGIKEEKGV
jgi:putative membrane protein